MQLGAECPDLEQHRSCRTEGGCTDTRAKDKVSALRGKDNDEDKDMVSAPRGKDKDKDMVSAFRGGDKVSALRCKEKAKRQGLRSQR